MRDFGRRGFYRPAPQSTAGRSTSRRPWAECRRDRKATAVFIRYGGATPKLIGLFALQPDRRAVANCKACAQPCQRWFESSDSIAARRWPTTASFSWAVASSCAFGSFPCLVRRQEEHPIQRRECLAVLGLCWCRHDALPSRTVGLQDGARLDRISCSEVYRMQENGESFSRRVILSGDRVFE
jgi:hypothetical protein